MVHLHLLAECANIFLLADFRILFFSSTGLPSVIVCLTTPMRTVLGNGT